MKSVYVFFVVTFAVLQPSLEQYEADSDRGQPYVETGEPLRYDRDQGYYMQRDHDIEQVDRNKVIDYLTTNLVQLKAISLAATDNFFFVSGDNNTGAIKDLLIQKIVSFKKLIQEQGKNISEHASDDVGKIKEVLNFETKKTELLQTDLVDSIRKEQEKVALRMSTMLDNLERIKIFFRTKKNDFGEYQRTNPLKVAADDLSTKAVKIYKKVRKIMQLNFKKTELLFTNNSEAVWTAFDKERMYLQELFGKKFENKKEFLGYFKALFVNGKSIINKHCKALLSNLNKHIKKQKKKFEQIILDTKNYIDVKTIFTEEENYEPAEEDSDEGSDEY